MNAAHIHLLLNHIPILGAIFGLALLLDGVSRKSDDIKKASFGTFVITALITIPVYLTGDGAAAIVHGLPGVSEAIIAQHDQAATVTLVAIELLGAVALWGLWGWQSAPGMAGWMLYTVLALAVISSGLGVWTGSLGGQVRHTEVRAGFSK